MEIRVRTHEELTADRVTIEIIGSRGEVSGLEDRIQDLLAENHRLDEDLARALQDRDGRERSRAGLEEELDASRAALAVEKRERNENREWAERTEALVERIRTKVWDEKLDYAMTHRGASEEIPLETVVTMADALAFVRATVGQPPS